MFTGLIERVGRLVELNAAGEQAELTVQHEPWASPLRTGESVAVNGACLTVVRATPERFTCHLLQETLRRTALRERRPGSALNLERALQVGDRLGGHFVSGHVDGVGEIVRIDRAGGDRIVEVRCPAALLQDIIPQGAVACDGVSLTVVGVGHDSFQVHMIPHTWTHTAFHEARPGSRVNLETDLLAKYVRRCLSAPSAGGGELTMERLARTGFL